MAVADFDLEVEPGELVGLIGPNGAGKTTTFNAVSGLIRPTGGEVIWDGRRIGGLKANRVNRLGIGRTFQQIRLFGEMSVLENVMAGYHGRLRSNFIEAVLRLPRYAREEREMIDYARRLLEEVDLIDLAREPAGSLAYGQQRRLEIARAMATKPRLLLLDEPAAGMNPRESMALSRTIRRLQVDYDLTILIIEHDMPFVMGLCPRLYVLDHGVNIALGTPREIRDNERVVAAYLGERRARG
ncbi:MAG: ABC transporter ATP-binding protein [Proteobacteria bacterium]|nr:ABC transporter ATP-binding protein [Pseudomonadota bacterium]MBU1742703.1 ABC transporter ATP-binding protein [Pseudomonadota bacterium]